MSLNTRASGGLGGGEGGEIGLQYVNKIASGDHEDEIVQVLLMGDRFLNTEAEVIEKRAKYHGGEPYWNANGLTRTWWRPEVESLVEKGIPVHTFHMATDDGTASNFREIANMSSGLGEMKGINRYLGSSSIALHYSSLFYPCRHCPVIAFVSHSIMTVVFLFSDVNSGNGARDLCDVVTQTLFAGGGRSADQVEKLKVSSKIYLRHFGLWRISPPTLILQESYKKTYCDSYTCVL